MVKDIMVVREFVPDALDGERVDRVVSFITGASRSMVSRAIQDGEILCNNLVIRKGSHKVVSGDLIVVESRHLSSSFEVEADPTISVPIVHEDPDFVVIDKPSGLVVHPATSHKTGTLVNGLLSLYPKISTVGEPERPGIVHRLDKGTSGLLVTALTPEGYVKLSQQIQNKTIGRVYTALVLGYLESERGVVDAPLGRDPKNPVRRAVVAGGKEARTRYEVIERYKDPELCCLVRCELETGRTHQIRAHFSAIGHPIAGDNLYGGASTSMNLGRPFLHSSSLTFQHPITNEDLKFSSKIPQELLEILEKFQ